ncbi:complement factor H-like isoform X2 [Crotalus tigris]|uniref:complement factor H-like isoform X2 n=1 Tax=Crotalus tigris TaxID=88082 RepID=UPI00192F8EC6|nr:complement factor H-like isoform X2 [Crotalus tigris]
MAFHFLGYTVPVLLLACFTAVAAQNACGPPPRREREQPMEELDAETYVHGHVVSYKCRPGYVKAWHIRLKCNDGVWQQLAPSKSCTGISCGHPGDSDYASFELDRGEDFTFGARVVYTCNEGYKMLSQFDYRECRANGWTNEVPHCEINKCRPIVLPSNVRIIQGAKSQMNEDFLSGDLVIFGCIGKLKIKGSNKITCTADGTWSAPVPECIEITCQADHIENGNILSPKFIYKEGERIRFTCIEGYTFADRPDALCTENGWGSKLQCKEIQCFPPEMTNGRFRPRRAQYTYNDEIETICDEGFVHGGPRKVSICTASGWNPPAFCKQIQCVPPQMTNGYFRPRRAQYTYNDEIETICNEGFGFEGPGKVSICTTSGWNPPAVCKQKVCDYIRIENGRMTDYLERYKPFPIRHRQTIQFLCSPGFLAADKQNRWQTATCFNSRYVPEPKCFKACDPSQYIYYGGFIYNYWNTYIEGDNITFACNKGYSPANQQSTVTCTKRGWSPPPRCIVTEVEHTCKVPLFQGHFVPEQQSFRINDKVKYICQDGYTTSKGETEVEIQCLTEGWSPEPECIRTCLESPADNFIFNTTKPVFFPGDVLHYECKEGFEITKSSISDTVMCTEKGWEPTPPRCVAFLCHAPFLENGTIDPREDVFQHKMVVHFNCDTGFTRVGPESAQCYHFGWSPLPPVCKENVKSCQALPRISHGMVTGERKAVYQHGDLLEVQCDISFALHGSKIIECVDGEWAPLPSCIEEAKTCGPPQKITKGSPVDATASIYRHGETVEYKCQKRSVIIGTNPAKCLHGQWELPSCLETCPPPPQLPNAINIAEMRIYRSEEEISFQCQEHFLLQGPQKIKCDDGKWQTPPRCLDLRCEPPPQIGNGVLEIENRTFFPGEVVKYTCVSGFKVSQINTVTCENKKWSELPVCKEKSCGPPPEIHNASLQQEDREEYDPGEIINYKCNRGFYAEGNASKTCSKGEWMGSFTCVDATCPEPPTVENAEIEEDTMKKYVHGEKINYQCNDGFEISGSGSVICTKKKWSRLPSCEDVRCSSPPQIQNGRIVSTIKEMYLPQEKVQYRCNPRYALLGSPFVKCLKKHWSQAPRCSDIGGKCGRPPPVENGDIVDSPKANYFQSESVTYQCQNLYTMEGSPRVTCHNGHWSQTPTCRAACTASEEDMRQHNIRLKWINGDKIYSADGNIVEFECIRRHKLHPNSGALRVNCVNGEFDYPHCIPNQVNEQENI